MIREGMNLFGIILYGFFQDLCKINEELANFHYCDSLSIYI